MCAEGRLNQQKSYSSVQGISQKPPNAVLKRFEAAEQAARDAQARSRAVDVMKGPKESETYMPSESVRWAHML